MAEVTTRFLLKVDQNGPLPEARPELGPCWLWLPMGGANGYGLFYHQGKTHLAHRFSYQLYIGQIPSRLVIDHVCRRGACVNPVHLEAVTQRENLKRCGASEKRAAHQRAQTHCPHGHAYSGENLRISQDGTRTCRTCERRHTAEYRLRNPRPQKPPRTHCRKGHVYAETGWTKSGDKRTCTLCSRAKVRAHRDRQKLKAIAAAV